MAHNNRVSASTTTRGSEYKPCIHSKARQMHAKRQSNRSSAAISRDEARYRPSHRTATMHCDSKHKQTGRRRVRKTQNSVHPSNRHTTTTPPMPYRGSSRAHSATHHRSRRAHRHTLGTERAVFPMRLFRYPSSVCATSRTKRNTSWRGIKFGIYRLFSNILQIRRFARALGKMTISSESHQLNAKNTGYIRIKTQIYTQRTFFYTIIDK